jgi:hypothetical protein
MRKTHRLSESDIRKIVRNILSEAELFRAVLPQHNDAGQFPAVQSPLPPHNDAGQFPAISTEISAGEAAIAFENPSKYIDDLGGGGHKNDYAGKRLLDAIATHLLNIGVFR